MLMTTIQAVGILGGPITSLLVVCNNHDDDGDDDDEESSLYYGHGPYLGRASLLVQRDCDDPLISSWRIMEAFASIHGILLDHDDKTILIVYGGYEIHRVNRFTGCKAASATCADWILTGQLWGSHLYVGLAHSTEVWCKHTLVALHLASDNNTNGITSAPRLSGLFRTFCSMDMIVMSSGSNHQHHRVRTAAGTVDRTIFVWDTNIIGEEQSENTVNTSDSHRMALSGHAGAVHAVTLNSTGDRLASASDDRTVRLWDLTNATTTSARTVGLTTTTSNYLVWTAYGHSARIWDVQFCRQPYGDIDFMVVSCGEDETVRFWDCGTGAALHTWKLNGCIWRIVCSTITTNNRNTNILVAAINTGGMAILDLQSAIPRTHTISIPDDRSTKSIPAPSIQDFQLLSKKKRKTQRKISDQVIFGPRAFPARAPANQNR